LRERFTQKYFPIAMLPFLFFATLSRAHFSHFHEAFSPTRRHLKLAHSRPIKWHYFKIKKYWVGFKKYLL
jgi:hypothetical protein